MGRDYEEIIMDMERANNLATYLSKDELTVFLGTKKKKKDYEYLHMEFSTIWSDITQKHLTYTFDGKTVILSDSKGDVRARVDTSDPKQVELYINDSYRREVNLFIEFRDGTLFELIFDPRA